MTNIAENLEISSFKIDDKRGVISCAYCGKERIYLKSFLKLHPMKYCSKKCHSLSIRNKIEVKCDCCGIFFLKRPDKIKDKNACSVKCSAALRSNPNAKWRNPNEIKMYMRNYRENNKDILNKKVRERLSNNEQSKILSKKTKAKWRDNNRGQIAVHAGHIRVKRGAKSDLTAKEWEEILIKYNYTCLCCGKSKADAKITLDHIIPISKGGQHSKDNVQPLCQSCNSQKYNKTIDYRIRFQNPQL